VHEPDRQAARPTRVRPGAATRSAIAWLKYGSTRQKGRYLSNMIEITIRDGREGRDRSRDSAEGGAILGTVQRDQPLEIGDVITLADGDSVVVIGDKDEIRPGESWKQTVFIGELRQPRRTLEIDLGTCPEWTLQSAGPTTATFVRCVDADEAEQINAAVSYCRKYATMPTYRLLNSSFRVWKQTFDHASNAPKEEWQPILEEDLLGAFVGWLLVWRLVLDQSEHDLSSRFGTNSSQLADFRLARSRAYDGSRAYRVVEALRNLVQHREMPSLRLNRTKQLDPTTGEVATGITYTFPASYLVSSAKCPATVKNDFRENPEEQLDLPAIIDQAMIAMNSVLLELAKIAVPELIMHVNHLRRVFKEASGAPLLLRVKPREPGIAVAGVNFEMVHFQDLQFLIENAPFPDATAGAGSGQ